VNTEQFRPGLLDGAERARKRREIGCREDSVVVLMVARLLRDKGVLELAEAAAIARAQQPNIEFVLAGGTDSGNFSSLTAAEIAKIGAHGALRLIGHRTDIEELLGASDLFVLPSYREGAPRSVLEAMACGLPIVTTDAPGCRDVVRHGVNGSLVGVRDARGLAEAVLALAGDAHARRTLGDASRRIAVAEFSVDRIIAAHFDLYREVLAA
jgi:glycosyltransferase involved in cell wall biosynthesis